MLQQTTRRLFYHWKKWYYLEPIWNKSFRSLLHQSSAVRFVVDPEEKPKDDEENSKKETSPTADKQQESKDKAKKESWETSSKPFNAFSKVVQETSPRLQPVDLFRKFRIWMILRALRSIWGEEVFTEELFLQGASSALTTVFDCLENGDLSSVE